MFCLLILHMDCNLKITGIVNGLPECWLEVCLPVTEAAS